MVAIMLRGRSASKGLFRRQGWRSRREFLSQEYPAWPSLEVPGDAGHVLSDAIAVAERSP
jgi:hypothetical protein